MKVKFNGRTIIILETRGQVQLARDTTGGYVVLSPFADRGHNVYSTKPAALEGFRKQRARQELAHREAAQ